MKVIHLLRKPCSEGTVAANVLKYGNGRDQCGRVQGGNGMWPLACKPRPATPPDL